MKRVLVTGAGGFIGRQCLLPLLSRGFDVHAVTRNSELETDAHLHSVDLTDESAMGRLLDEVQPSHLLALAWPVVPGKFYTSEENIHWVRYTMRLVEMFAERGGQRVVTAGTSYEYDLRYGYCREAETPCRPETVYGQSKHALRILTDAFASQQELSAAWARIFFIYGPHEKPQRLIPYAIRQLMDGETAEFSHGRQIRDFIHVIDLAEGLVALLDSDAEGAFNVASGEAVTLRAMIEHIAVRLDAIDRVRFGVHEAPAHEPPLLVADTHLVREATGWKPRMNIIEGLDATLEFYGA